MTLDDLRAALAPQDGLLSVDGARLGSARITSVFRGLLPGGVLELSGAVAQPGRFTSGATAVDAVEVTGTLVPTVLGAPGLAVQAWFFLVDATPDVVATLTGMPDPWTPPVSFAGTAGTDVADVTFRGCVFTIDSRPRPGLEAAFDAVLQYDTAANTAATSPPALVTSPTPRPGLSLSATLDLGSLDETLSDVLQVADTAQAIALAVSGDIEMVGDRPRMRLRTTTPVASFSFQDVTLTVDHEFLTAPMQDTESAVIQKVRERLITTLVYRGASETLTVPLAATFDPESLAGGVILANEPGLGSALSLQTLAGLIPGGVSAALPTTIPGLDQLALTDFALQADRLAGDVLLGARPRVGTRHLAHRPRAGRVRRHRDRPDRHAHRRHLAAAPDGARAASFWRGAGSERRLRPGGRQLAVRPGGRQPDQRQGSLRADPAPAGSAARPGRLRRHPLRSSGANPAAIRWTSPRR